MARAIGVQCDGCGSFVATGDATSKGRPGGWYSVRVDCDRTAQRRLDLCSPMCATPALSKLAEELV